jgi:hypothetical protein
LFEYFTGIEKTIKNVPGFNAKRSNYPKLNPAFVKVQSSYWFNSIYKKKIVWKIFPTLSFQFKGVANFLLKAVPTRIKYCLVKTY